MLASLTSSALLLALAGPSPATTQPAPLVKKSPVHPYESRYGVSLAAGSTSGLGIGVRKHFKNRWGFNLAAVPFLGKDSGFTSLGVQATYSFFRGRIARLYVLAGLHGIYQYTSQTHNTMVPAPQSAGQAPGQPGQTFLPGPPITRIDRTYHTNFGPGLGLELHFSKRFSWALELPVATMIKVETTSNSNYRSTQTRVLPIPNTAITLYY